MHGIAPSTMHHAQMLWDFMSLRQPCTAADAILCLGSNDIQVPRVGARLWQEKWAPYLIMSGGLAHQHDLAATGWSQPEADVFSREARHAGVPRDAILCERAARHTGDNFRLTRCLAEESGIMVSGRLIIVAKPYMTRRAQATAEMAWPEVETIVQCEDVELISYLHRWQDPQRILHLMVGDMQRIMVYPERGFQRRQPIPEDVRLAQEALIAQGFDRHLP